MKESLELLSEMLDCLLLGKTYPKIFKSKLENFLQVLIIVVLNFVMIIELEKSENVRMNMVNVPMFNCLMA